MPRVHVLRIEAEKLCTEPAADRRHAAAEREGDREQTIDIDAERFGHTPVVDHGADLGADPCALEGEPEAEDNQDSDRNQEDTVGTIPREAELDLASQRRWQVRGTYKNPPAYAGGSLGGGLDPENLGPGRIYF